MKTEFDREKENKLNRALEAFVYAALEEQRRKAEHTFGKGLRVDESCGQVRFMPSRQQLAEEASDDSVADDQRNATLMRSSLLSKNQPASSKRSMLWTSSTGSML